MVMIQIAALAYAGICVLTLLFQAAVIAGAPWGHLTQGGRFEGALPLSGRVAAVVSCAVLVAMGFGILSAAGLWPNWPGWTGWVVLGLQVLSTGMNWITPSAPERRIWGPVTTVMLALVLCVMFWG